MTSTDLKPGDLARHAEKGIGVIALTLSRRLGVGFVTQGGFLFVDTDFTGWERVETEIVRPGHVQVRVDDLAGIRQLLGRWASVDEVDIDPHENNLPEHNAESTLLVRITKAIAAQRAESTTPAQPDEPTEVGVKLTLGGTRLISTDRFDDGERIFTCVDDGYAHTWRDIVWIAWRDSKKLSLGWDE